jgi:hypothetical protein
MAKLRLTSTLALGTLLLAALTGCSGMDMPGLPTMSNLQSSSFDSSAGGQLASFALSQATGGTGYCYHYVATAIHAQVPAFLSGGHAYMAADQLAASPYFQEVSLPASSLTTLPAGAVVVWDKGHSESGHISIADGRGNEISDHLSVQMTSHYGGGSYRVFVRSAG